MGAITKAFKSGNSVAVRLPKELGITEGMELEVEQAPTGVFLRRKPKFTGRDLIEARHAVRRVRVIDLRDLLRRVVGDRDPLPGHRHDDVAVAVLIDDPRRLRERILNFAHQVQGTREQRRRRNGGRRTEQEKKTD